ncbi:MAG: AMP-binding protein [Desulfoarculaceae bacterium]|nr:AMP-binding protein [Desulfoarculaceae bacterium]
MTDLHPQSSPGHKDPSRSAEQLLALVQALARELQPGFDHSKDLGLDHELERNFGLDSLARVELLARIERELGIRLSEAAFAEAETGRDLLRLMGGEGRTKAPTTPAAPVAGMEMKAGRAENEIEQPPPAVTSLVEILDWRAAHHGDRVHITLYLTAEQTEDITYRMLQVDARTLASNLLARGLQGGDRVAIMLPTDREFFTAFYGALYAGCVPVPLYPPARPSQIEEHMRRIAGIVTNAKGVMLVTDDRTKPLGHLLRAQCASLSHIATVADLSRPVAARLPAHPDALDIAFLQYTSGSTGTPKGVVLTHANLLANLRAMAQASGVTSEDIFVSWLPLYHDMGLIGACLGSLFIGFRLVLMSPLAFLARPARWLRAIHYHRATVSAAPNFAYEICASKIDEHDLKGLDLSCWRLAYNGAEPVSPATIEGFSARLAAHGFTPEAMTPVYGLAESSVGLAFPPLGRGPLFDRVDRTALSERGIARTAGRDDAHARRIVSCGRPLPGHRIRIIDGNGHELPERTQGRVQFMGPSATRGYFRNPEANRRLFDGQWLNSGDLGYLAGGELYLTGREKDIIIRGGHNIHPQELEEAVSRLPDVRKGAVAIFPASDIRSGTERLVVLAETREKKGSERYGRLVAEINRLAVDLLGMPADDIVLAPPGAVLKTSSGKIRRAACRERYEQGGSTDTAQRPPWQQWLRLAATGAVTELKRRLKHGAGWMWSVWACTVFILILPGAWLLIVLAPTLGLRRLLAKASAGLVLTLIGLRPRVEGLQHLSGQGPVIVTANHASYLDAWILTAVLPPRFAYVAKQELLHQPLAALPLRRLATSFVERFDSARGIENSREMEERVRAGDALIFFPEGTFRSEPGLLPFRMGAFVVAAQTGIPVVPVTLIGTRDLLRGERLRPHYSALRVLIDQPLSPAGKGWLAALQLRDSARRRIAAHLEKA